MEKKSHTVNRTPSAQEVKKQPPFDLNHLPSVDGVPPPPPPMLLTPPQPLVLNPPRKIQPEYFKNLGFVDGYNSLMFVSDKKAKLPVKVLHTLARSWFKDGARKQDKCVSEDLQKEECVSEDLHKECVSEDLHKEECVSEDLHKEECASEDLHKKETCHRTDVEPVGGDFKESKDESEVAEILLSVKEVENYIKESEDESEVAEILLGAKEVEKYIKESEDESEMAAKILLGVEQVEGYFKESEGESEVAEYLLSVEEAKRHANKSELESEIAEVLLRLSESEPMRLSESEPMTVETKVPSTPSSVGIVTRSKAKKTIGKKVFSFSAPCNKKRRYAPKMRRLSDISRESDEKRVA